MTKSTFLFRLSAVFALTMSFLIVISPAVSASSNSCNAIIENNAWAECLRKSRLSSEEQLNFVYKKETDKLQGKPDIAHRLREAQRRWVAFREAQCAAEDSEDLSVAKSCALFVECSDRMASEWTDYLLAILLCNSEDLSCSTSIRSSGTIQPGEVKKAVNDARSGIPFESPDVIEKLKVSGVWFPEQIKPYVGLSGAAIFNFENIKTGEIFHAAVNGIGLLAEDYWQNHGIENLNRISVSDLKAKLSDMGPVKIRLSADARAKVVDCDAKSGSSKRSTVSPDKCLQLGIAVVDIQDVDMSMSKKFVFRQPGQAQRGVASYEIMTLPFDRFLNDSDFRRPLNDLDEMSKINTSKREIILHESNGACASANMIYAAGKQGVRLIGREQYVDQDGVCYFESFKANDTPDGEDQFLTLVSRKRAE